MNRIDKKYLWSRWHTVTDPYLIDEYSLTKLITPDKEAFLQDIRKSYIGQSNYENAVSDILRNWSDLQEYFNGDYQYSALPSDSSKKKTVFRGMSFDKNNYQSFFKLLDNINKKHTITSKYPRSWTLDRITAIEFACYNQRAKNSLKTALGGVVITSSFSSREVIDFTAYTPSWLLEVLSPPGTFDTKVYFCYCILEDGNYYYADKRFNVLSLSSTINRMIGFDIKTAIIITDLDEFISLSR